MEDEKLKNEFGTVRRVADAEVDGGAESHHDGWRKLRIGTIIVLLTCLTLW